MVVGRNRVLNIPCTSRFCIQSSTNLFLLELLPTLHAVLRRSSARPERTSGWRRCNENLIR